MFMYYLLRDLVIWRCPVRQSSPLLKTCTGSTIRYRTRILYYQVVNIINNNTRAGRQTESVALITLTEIISGKSHLCLQYSSKKAINQFFPYIIILLINNIRKKLGLFINRYFEFFPFPFANHFVKIYVELSTTANGFVSWHDKLNVCNSLRILNGQ